MTTKWAVITRRRDGVNDERIRVGTLYFLKLVRFFFQIFYTLQTRKNELDLKKINLN